MKTIESKVVGTLHQHEEIRDWWKSAPVHVELVDAELPVSFIEFEPERDGDFLKDAEEALTNFLELSSFYRLQMIKYIHQYFLEFSEYLDEKTFPEKMKDVQPLAIWNFVYPTEIFVSRRLKNDKDIYIVLACECEWDKEHGLQLVFRKGMKLTRVSDQDGHVTEADAFDIPDSEDALLSAF